MTDPPRYAPARAVTMRDVAARAGVAVSTVSRVVSQPERISASTRETVLRAMRDLGYRPPSSRVAARGPVGTVALLVPDITNPFYFDIIRGSQDRLKASGYAQVLIDTEESLDVEAASLDLLGPTSVGAILAAPRLDEDRLRAAAARFPLVTVNRRVDGVPTVVIDSGAAVEQAVEHLASLGHARVCYIGGPAGSWANHERWRGCTVAAARLGVELVRVGPFPPRTTSGAAAADALLNTAATAGIAFNDLIAIGMLQRFAARAVRVPEELSLVGCDDIFGADFCSPPLTTLTAPIMQAGRVATARLLALANGSSPAGKLVTTLPAHLTIRASTGTAPSRR